MRGWGSFGAGTTQSGFMIHRFPHVASLTSPLGITLNMTPSWPRPWPSVHGHIQTEHHVYTCMLAIVWYSLLQCKDKLQDIIIIIYKQGGLLRSPPAAPNLPLLPSHTCSYIPAHMHAIKQGCERADIAHMKTSKERVKGTGYVNSTRLILPVV